MSVGKYRSVFLFPHLFHLQLFHSNPAVVHHPVLRQSSCCAYSAMVSGHVLYRALMPAISSSVFLEKWSFYRFTFNFSVSLCSKIGVQVISDTLIAYLAWKMLWSLRFLWKKPESLHWWSRYEPANQKPKSVQEEQQHLFQQLENLQGKTGGYLLNSTAVTVGTKPRTKTSSKCGKSSK